MGAIAKGVRKTRSRFGGRLEPLSHVELVLHEGRGELQTVTGATLVRSHHAIRDDARRSAIGLVGAEAVLAPLPRAGAKRSRVHGHHALPRSPRRDERRVPRAELDPLGLAFQLKLLWLAGYLPHVGSCAECGAEENIVGYSPRAGGAVCVACAADALHALRRRSGGGRFAASSAARGRGRDEHLRPSRTRCAGSRLYVVRVSRRLSITHALSVISLQSRVAPVPSCGEDRTCGRRAGPGATTLGSGPLHRPPTGGPGGCQGDHDARRRPRGGTQSAARGADDPRGARGRLADEEAVEMERDLRTRLFQRLYRSAKPPGAHEALRSRRTGRRKAA